MIDIEKELYKVKGELERVRQLYEWQQADYSKIRELQNELHTLQGQYRVQRDRLRISERANEALITALSRCRDIMQVSRETITDKEMRHDLSIYLNLIEGVLTGKPVEHLPTSEMIMRMRERAKTKIDGGND